MQPIQVTDTQFEVMKWLRGGWRALQNNGQTMEINGKKVCTEATMRALEKNGLVEKLDAYYWASTCLGNTTALHLPGHSAEAEAPV
jgi:hypothetical protein